MSTEERESILEFKGGTSWYEKLLSSATQSLDEVQTISKVSSVFHPVLVVRDDLLGQQEAKWLYCANINFNGQLQGVKYTCRPAIYVNGAVYK